MLFDAIQAILGRPDPRMAVAQALGQAPGQPGGGPPVPGAPSPAPGGGGPPPSPGGPQAGQGAPQGQGAQPATMPNGQPAPTAFQSPSDLAQAYLKLASYNQNAEMFNRALGGIAGSFGPIATRPSLTHAYDNAVQDPNSVFGAMMKLQQFGQEQQNYQAMRAGVPQMLKDAGISQDYAPLVMAQPGLLGDILKVRMGVTGDPAERALQAARNDWLMHNPGKTENDMLAAHPEYSDPISYAATKTGEATTASAIAKDQATDRNAATRSLPALVTSTGDMLTNLDKIIGASDDDLSAFVGNPIAAAKPLTGAFASGNRELASSIDQAVKQTFGEGFREVAGKTSRVTNTEATSLSGSLSQLQNRGLSPSAFRAQAQIVKDRLLHTLGTAYGEAGLSDNLPDYLKGNDSAGNPYLDSEYAAPAGGKAGGARYWQSGGEAPPGRYPGLSTSAPASSSGGGQPVTVQTIDDVRKLKSGTPFIIPEGPNKGKIGYAP